MRFTPLPTFTGAANPATYRVQDANGTVATATITPTITPVTPAAEDDAATARQGAPASVAVLGNDAPGDAGVPLDPASLRLLDAAGQPTTSVTVAGTGRGGRNLEYIAGLAPEIAGLPVVALAADTDGTDGGAGDAKDPAGAIVDGESVARARAHGLDPAAFLADNNSTGFFAALGDLVMPGPTYTNVNDFRAIIVDRP